MLSAIAGLFGAYLEARAIKKVTGEIGTYLDNWARLIASIVITSFVTFTVTWGAVGAAVLAAGHQCWTALVGGFLTAIFAVGAIVYQLWTRSPLTKGIAIAVPSKYVETILQENVTISERS